MHRKVGSLLCALIMTALPVLSATGTGYPLGMIDFSGENRALEVSQTSPEHTTISLTAPNIVVEEKVVDFEVYHVFGIPGEPFVFDEGCPTVPHVTRFYRIPNTGSADLVITQAEYELVENINPFPFQITEGAFDRLARNEAILSQDTWYPSTVAEISKPMIMRDFRVVTVTLHPVQINPVTGQARLYNLLETEIVTTDEPGYNELHSDHPPSGRWAPIYNSLITNLDDYALDNATRTPGSYLILCKDNTQNLPWADSLYQWKKRRGFDVVIEARNNWTASSMRQFIQSFYASSDPPLEFVALMGDPASFGVPTDGSNYDHTFGLGNNYDDIEDFGVGRLCGASVTEMNTINAKIMGYERTPWMEDTEWFRKSYLLAGVANDVASNYLLMQWSDQMFTTYTGVDNNTVDWVYGHVNDADVRSQFASGIGYFLWRGTWLSQMEPSLANTCNSGWRLPVVLTVTCGTGNFTSGLGTSESYLVAGSPTAPRGGICGIGSATSGTHNPQNVTFSGGLIQAMSALNIEHIGHCMNHAKAWLYLTYGTDGGYASSFSRYNNLLGDPGLSLWTDVPRVLDVTHPAALNVGARHVRVEVLDNETSDPVADALVVLWKGDETYARVLTDEEGIADVPVTVETAGDILLTITKRNHKPYLYTIPCGMVDLMVTAGSWTIDDDNSGGTFGNADGQVNPGETVDLMIYLKNFGTGTTATDVTATLTSHSDNIAVISETTNCDNLAPGDSALVETPFRLSISPTMMHEETGLVKIAVTASTVLTQSAVELTCTAGKLNYVSYDIPNFGPGETGNLAVTIQNVGNLNMTAVTGELISQSPFVTVDDNDAAYGNIPTGQQANNSTDRFVLTANSLTFRGHQAPMLLIAQTSSGYIDTVQFIVTVGTALTSDPTGPDAYGYYAYDNTDVGYELAPDFDYFPINTVGVDLNLNDSGEKTNISQLWSTVRPLPFSFTFYGNTYNQVTICANGWIAFGDQGWNDQFRNYMVPSMQAPEAMIAPYWDDLKTSLTNQGVWEYYDSDNDRYIVQWKAGCGDSYGTPLDFQVILYDEEEYPTLDGNGMILMQYQDIQMDLPGNGSYYEISGSTVGIQAPQGQVGLHYAYRSDYASGAAPVQDGRAILFSTDARAMFGTVMGTVRDAATEEPFEGALVTMDGYSYHDTTDEFGLYTIENVLIGTYNIRASAYRYNDAVVNGVIVELDSTEIVDFSITHPELTVSVDEINVTVPTDPYETTFDLVNDGNGPFEYEFKVSYRGDESPDPWDYLEGIDVTDATGNMLMQGCEFANDEWWASGGGAGGPNLLYRFDLYGQLTGTLLQPSTTSFGWYDMAWDGEYLYGSDGRDLKGIDLEGNVHETIPTPLNPARAVAYDEQTDHFWVADMVTDIYEIDRSGNIIQQIEYESLGETLITGLAWHSTDPEGFKLYVFGKMLGGNSVEVRRIHPTTQQVLYVLSLESEEGDRPGGCAITPGWNSTLLVFGAILSNPQGDRIGIYELDFNTTWIDVSPMAASVQGDHSRTITVTFDDTYLRPFTYQANLTFTSEVLDTTIVLPITLVVEEVAVDPGSDQPGVVQEYSLHQNYPNPFNPSTLIRFDLKETGHAKLAIYNLMGQEISVLMDNVQTAGRHQIRFDASSLPSGVYFYRLTAGDFTAAKKMMLMK